MGRSVRFIFLRSSYSSNDFDGSLHSSLSFAVTTFSFFHVLLPITSIICSVKRSYRSTLFLLLPSIFFVIHCSLSCVRSVLSPFPRLFAIVFSVRSFLLYACSFLTLSGQGIFSVPLCHRVSNASIIFHFRSCFCRIQIPCSVPNSLYEFFWDLDKNCTP